MGAADFFTTARGKTAQEAFGAALDEARHMFGRGGYTGTIAEKDGFKMVSVPPGWSTQANCWVTRTTGSRTSGGRLVASRRSSTRTPESVRSSFLDGRLVRQHLRKEKP